jgi:hypothetical protein
MRCRPARSSFIGGCTLAEQVKLLEHCLERQSGVVDQKQLTLVVPDIVAESHRALDDLLRRPHRQRSLGSELLQRRTVAINRGVVEIRPELTNGVLTVLAHEDLTAQPHDGLGRGAVPVVLETPPVGLDHPLRVRRRPEDVVGEEPVAVVGRQFRDLRRTDRAVPHERRHVGERSRRQGEALQRCAEPALPVDDLLPPQSAQQAVVLDRQRDGVADVLTEPRVHRAGVTAPEHQVGPSAGQVLQDGEVLGDLDRVVGGDQGGGSRQDDALGLGRDVAEQRRR